MKSITNLAISNDKKNKTRSVLIIIAVLLSTMLLTIIGLFCYGSIKFNRDNAAIQYGSYYGVYANVTQTQIYEMQLRSEFTDIGRMAYAGEGKGNKDIKFYWADDTVRKLANLNRSLLEGSFPKKENEVTLQKDLLKQLGYDNARLGDSITLSCRSDNSKKYETHSFVISGILKNVQNGIEQKSFPVYISKDYYDGQFSKEQRRYQAYFRLNNNDRMNSDKAEDALKKLAGKCNITEKQVIANTYYLYWTLDPSKDTIMGGLLIASFVVVFSVLVIYNIFQVGVTQKIQEYGKIKAIGATKKQLRGIIFREGMILAMIGIPIGLLFGSIVTKLSFAWMIRLADSLRPGTELIKVSIISIPMLCGVALIAFVTVWLALRKPMKIVSRISPIEAIRYQEKRSKTSGVRKGYSAMGVKEMTLASLSANKKRTVMTVCAMGLSCVLFVIIANLMGNIDNEYDARQSIEYGQFKISLDYSLSDKAYPENNLDSILNNNPLGKDRIEQLKKIDGITDINTRNILAMRMGKQLESVLVLDKRGFEYYAQGEARIGKLDYETAVKEDAIIYGWSHFMEEEGYSLGQNIQGNLYGEKDGVKYQGILQGAFGSCGLDWAITDRTARKLGFSNDNTGIVWVDCSTDNVAMVKEKLNKFFAGDEHIDIETYEDALKESKISTRLMQLSCYTILAIIGVIGFMNIANTLIISTITRKHELGVLQAIGMTNNQLNHMLQMEGILYTFGTVLVAVIIGVPAGYGAFRYGRLQQWTGLNVYHFPWLEILAMILVLSTMQLILSYLLSRNVQKESLVERIRYEE